MESLEFFKGELDLLDTPEAFEKWLYDIHEEFDLYDVSELLGYYENKQSFEICAIIKKFQDEVIKQ